jgi:AraC family transcriptional regulator
MLTQHSMSAQDLREWHETNPESATVTYVSQPGQYQGIQVMRASHRLRRFKVTSGGHVVMIYHGNPTECQVHNGKSTQRKLQVDGNAYLFPAGEQVDATCDGNINDDVYLKLQPEFLNRVATQAGLRQENVELVLHADPEDRHLKQIAALFDGELKGDCLNGRLFGESLAHALAVHLLRKYAVIPAKISEPIASLSNPKLRMAIAYIHDNLAEDLTLAEIAAEVGYSPYYLHRLFKLAVGKPIHQFVTEARLARARTLIRSSSLPIAVIAAEVGFSDHGHLARHLRRSTGLTPRQLRDVK